MSWNYILKFTTVYLEFKIIPMISCDFQFYFYLPLLLLEFFASNSILFWWWNIKEAVHIPLASNVIQNQLLFILEVSIVRFGIGCRHLLEQLINILLLLSTMLYTVSALITSKNLVRVDLRVYIVRFWLIYSILVRRY